MPLLILAIFFVVLSLWLTATLAKALGAGSPSMWNVVVSGMVSGLVMGPVSLAVTNPVLLILLTLVVSTACFAKFLDMNLVGAFLVYLANGFIWAVFLVGAIFFGLGLNFDWNQGFESYSGEVSLAAVEIAAEDICACGTDEQCQIDMYFTHAQVLQAFTDSGPGAEEMRRAQSYDARANDCYDHPRPYQPRALVESRSRPAAAPRQEDWTAGLASAEPPAQSGKQARTVVASAEVDAPSYQEVPVGELVRYLSHPMRVTRKDDKQFEGQASLLPNGDLRLTHRRMGGEFGLVIPAAQLRRVEVFKVWRAEVAPKSEALDSVASAQG